MKVTVGLVLVQQNLATGSMDSNHLPVQTRLLQVTHPNFAVVVVSGTVDIVVGTDPYCCIAEVRGILLLADLAGAAVDIGHIAAVDGSHSEQPDC